MGWGLSVIEAFIRRRAGRVAESTLRKYRHDWNRWERSGAETADDFREWGIDNGLSVRTIESTLSTAKLAIGVEIGEPLAKTFRRLVVPSAETIKAIYDAVDVAKWPTRVPTKLRPHWWRCLIGVACMTGLRLGDLERLDRGNLDGGYLVVRAAKTARVRRPDLAIPLTPELRRHTNAIPFRLTRSRRQLYRELERIAEAAGTPYVRPKQMRQFAITQWSSVDSMAGKIVQGCSLGVMGHYVDVGRFLSSVATRVRWPFEAISDDAERLERELVDHYRRSNRDQQNALLTIARSVA